MSAPQVEPTNNVARLSDLNADLAALWAKADAIATGNQAAGNWDASSGAFPSGSSDGTFYVVDTAGTVDGQAFAVGDLIWPLMDNASTSTFDGNWARGDLSALVPAGLPKKSFKTVADLTADNTLGYASGGSVTVIVADGDIVQAGPMRFEVQASGATGNPIATAGGVKLKPLVSSQETYNLRQFDVVADGSTDDTTAFDAALTFAWTNYTQRMTFIVPDGMLLNKAGDFVMPPNVMLKGETPRATIIFGNALTRLYYKRDNTRVDAAYQGNEEYWNLGPNIIDGIRLKPADGVTVANAIFFSDLSFFQVRNVDNRSDGGTGTITTMIQMENDAYWDEYWIIENTSFTVPASGSGLLFTRTGSSTFASFGHGTLDNVTLAVLTDGAAGMRVQDAASVYSLQGDINGFVAAPTGVQEAYLIKLEDSGSDIKHADLRVSIENLGNNGTPYAIHVDTGAGAEGGKINGFFRGVGDATKFRGVTQDSHIITTMLAQPEDVSGTAITGRNGFPMRVTADTDSAGDNLQEFVDMRSDQVHVADFVVANTPLFVFPPFKSSSAIILSIQMLSNNAPSGNTNGGWQFGIFRTGAGSASATFTMTNGSTNQVVYPRFGVPSGWVGETGPSIRSMPITASTTNDGNPPRYLNMRVTWLDV